MSSRSRTCTHAFHDHSIFTGTDRSSYFRARRQAADRDQSFFSFIITASSTFTTPIIILLSIFEQIPTYCNQYRPGQPLWKSADFQTQNIFTIKCLVSSWYDRIRKDMTARSNQSFTGREEMTLIIFELYTPNYGRAARKFLQTTKSELFTRRYNILIQNYVIRFDSIRFDSIHFIWSENEAEMPLALQCGRTTNTKKPHSEYLNLLAE